MATLLISGGQLAKLSDLSEQSTLSEQSVGKADLLSDHFDSKQSRECVDRPLNYLPSPRLYTFTVMSSEVRRLLLNLDPYRGSDELGMFPLFHKRTADVLAPVLVQCFDGCVRLGSFPACNRQANAIACLLCNRQAKEFTVRLCCQTTDRFR